MQSRSSPTGRVSSLGNRADRLGHLPPPCLSVPSASACQHLLWRRSRARLGQEEIPAGGVDSRAAGCVPRSQTVSGAPPCRAQDGGSRPPPICCEPGWRGSRSLGPGWGGASPGGSPCIDPGPAGAAAQRLLPLDEFLPVKGGSSVCYGNPPVEMWALLMRAAFQEQPLVRGLRSVEPSFVEGPVVGATFHVGRRSAVGGAVSGDEVCLALWQSLEQKERIWAPSRIPSGATESCFLPGGRSFLFKDLAKSGGPGRACSGLSPTVQGKGRVSLVLPQGQSPFSRCLSCPSLCRRLAQQLLASCLSSGSAVPWSLALCSALSARNGWPGRHGMVAHRLQPRGWL